MNKLIIMIVAIMVVSTVLYAFLVFYNEYTIRSQSDPNEKIYICSIHGKTKNIGLAFKFPQQFDHPALHRTYCLYCWADFFDKNVSQATLEKKGMFYGPGSQNPVNQLHVGKND